ncbi:hypothetical protein D7W79_07595 [Corallococcus exercitus]|uniref:WD40 repeat domain-containing protein n=1 Tax=Corallococcus exercitus TaxID=2316736 RepID=A0A3A8ID46_9BACT|nr:hypothetical protein [Corallococcus exercitus]NOK33649.1 hypothetical protein [Corallococcus exercitus]RKG80556.1 hypothetical protein D7W79_07595 [Corallococcus exercitus]
MAGRALGLVLLGMGLSHCKGDPDVADAGVDAGVSPVQTVVENAKLLQVDARQTFLLSVKGDGTYAQALPTGEPSRIAAPAEQAIVASDGGAVVLWSPQGEGQVRTLWLWRPGTEAAIPMSTRAWDVAHDPGMSFVAFTEFDPVSGVNSVRVARTDTCTREACPLWTALERPSRGLVLKVGGTTLLASEGTQAWLIDVPSSTVTELGPTVAYPAFATDGTRYALFDAANHVQVFDTATRTLQWEQVWRDEATRKGWHVSNAFMTDVGTLILNIKADLTPETDSVACDATGCRDLEGGLCRNWERSSGVVLCLIDRWVTPNEFTRDAAYLDGTARTLVGTETTRRSSVYPAFSADLRNQAWTVRETRDGAKVDTLWWKTPDATHQTPLEGLTDSTLFAFTPGARQVLFARTLTTADGKPEHRLSLWDGEAVSDLAVLEDAPFLNPIPPMVRDNPPTLYLTVTQGEYRPTSVIRVPLP